MSNLLSKKRDQRGFTLIELLVVVAIIGVLMAIGISNYLGYKTSGANAAAHATAADYLTLSMAQAAATNPPAAIGPLVPATGTPVGFVLPATITVGGAGISISAAGAITGTATFIGSSGGTTTYIVDSTGTVHE